MPPPLSPKQCVIVYGGSFCSKKSGSGDGVENDIHVGEHVQMRKPHPCGGDTWEVYRIGADIGIRCLTCQRRVMLVRSEFFKRMKRKLQTTANRSDGDILR